MQRLNIFLILLIPLLLTPRINHAQAPDLGVATTFALFTAVGAFNGDPGTSVIGDIGTDNGAFTPPGFHIGAVHVSDPTSNQAALDVADAYSYLDGLTCGQVLTTPLGNGQILAPNTFCIGTAAVLNANLILDAGGDPGAIFIFQIDGALSTNPGSSITLVNGANLCNVYWQINGAFNHNGTSFLGTVIAEGAINLGFGAILRGRGLSTAGAISTSSNSVELPQSCLCELDVTCPDPAGGTFECISDIPAGSAADVTINSSCGATSVVITATSTGAGCAASPYILTRTYTVTDDGGFSSSCVVTYIAIDQTPPTITCPADVSVSCTNSVPAPAPGSIVAADVCGAVTVTHLGDAISAQTCPNSYTIIRTYQAADACGNTTTCDQIITVNDLTAPTITCPANVQVSCAGDVPPPAPGAVVASDLCGTVTVTHLGDVISAQTCANRYTITRTYQAEDACGNTASCDQIITVNDLTAPTITCPANVQVTCAGDVPPPAPASVIASDLCGGIVTVTHLGDVITPGTCPNRFTVARTYQAEDVCGNTASCVQIITVNDLTGPSIICPANVLVSCAANVPPPSTASVTASDLCGGAVTIVHVGDVITGQTCPNRFTITRTYRATDICGNSATCAQIITVNDLTAPIITCPANVQVVCASNVPAPAPASIIASDLCGGAVTIVHVGDVISAQICANRLTITRTYRATDLCGNSATCAQIITVNDNIAPVFLNTPANVTVECFGIPGVPPLPTATDNCAGLVTVEFLGETQTDGICPILYVLERTWRATDVCGNSTTVSQLVTVQDTYAPQFIVPPVDVVLECNLLTNEADYLAWLNNNGGAEVFDCSEITWSWIYSPLFTMPSTCGGTSQRLIRFIATDECGNSSFSDARFTIIDTTPPTFTVLPLNLEVECWNEEQGEAQLIEWTENFGYAEVSDDCGAVVTSMVLLSTVQECGFTFTKTFQFRATDECGNTTYVTATFAVVDILPPVITTCPPGNALLTCEHDIPAPDIAGVVAIDNCGSVTVTVESIFSYGVGCKYWPLTTSYTYAVTDECGNVATCYQSFQVVDSIPPTYNGPDTIFVQCVADLPGPGDLTDVLAPYFVDNCYNIICVSEGVSSNGTNSVTFCVNFKDLCVNWADKFFVTFVAIGGCKPICTAPQSNWGDPGGTINGLNTKEVIEQLIGKNGAVTAGKLGKTISVSSAECLQSILPGNGHTNQFTPPGNHLFGAENECQPNSVLLNADGTLKNKLAANVLAMQLNIWYNLDFNQRDLRVQLMSSLPVCLVDPLVLSRIHVDMPNVQGLLNLSNDYLAGVGGFPPQFGTPLNSALENVNNYWKNCQLNDPCSSTVTVAGSLKTENMDGLEAGKVLLEGFGSAGPMPNTTAIADINGQFEFTNAVPLLNNYTLTPSTINMAYLNGVTTYDLVLISKHILGVEPLNSPYKMIAADANKSGSITTFDIVELRKLILGIYDELPNTTAWRFVDKAFTFPVPENPFSTAFPERIVVENTQASRMTEDFISVKIGDVNGSAHANGLMQSEDRSSSILLFDLDDRFVQLGEILEVKFTADQVVQGYQLTLNTEGFEVLEIVGKGMSADHFAVYPADAALAMSWNLPEGTAGFAAEFTLKVRATQSGQLSKMLSLSSRITRAEAYQNKEAGSNHPLALDVALRFHQTNGVEISGTAFELYQNVPNPFVDKTSIGFYLPEATQATLTIYDQTGRLIYTAKSDFDKGANVFELDQSLINNTGSMLYKVATATDMAVKKMMQTK